MVSYTLEQVYSFCLAAEYGSFSKAARLNGKDRTTLSEHVNNLEISLNVSLFERMSNKLVITNEGVQLLRVADNLLRQARSLQVYADSLYIPERNHFRIVTDTYLPDNFICDVTCRLDDCCANMNIDWLSLGRDKALPMLINGDIDLAIVLKNSQFTKLLPPKGLSAVYLGKLYSALYVSVNSPLQSKHPVGFYDLLYDTRYLLQNTLEAGLAEQASYSGHQVVLSSVDLILKFLERGGWAFLPKINSIKENPKIMEVEAEFLNQAWPIEHILFARDDILCDSYQHIVKAIKLAYNNII